MIRGEPVKCLEVGTIATEGIRGSHNDAWPQAPATKAGGRRADSKASPRPCKPLDAMSKLLYWRGN